MDEQRPADAEREDYEADVLVLEDESGQEHSFEVIDATDVDDQHYLALVPYSEDPAAALEQDTELVIMRLAELDGEEVLDVVEDDEELQMVGSVFLHRLQDLYDIDLKDLGLDKDQLL